MYAEVGDMNEMTMAYFIVLPRISEQLDPEKSKAISITGLGGL
jgi:hypothetical protein